MIYAKEKPLDAKRMLGVKLYNNLYKKLGPAGMGHEYYEKWRSEENPSVKQQLQKDCKKYYRSIRKKNFLTLFLQ